MIFGHLSQISYMQKTTDEDRFANGYIFSGVEGIGKKLLAKETARACLCKEKSKIGEDCGCISCIQAKSGIHPDIEIAGGEDKSVEDSDVDDGEKLLNINKIREISESAFLSPYSGKRKFYILDNFHEMRAEGCNAFLKTLEEPPLDTTFFLITHRIDLILPTIKSRCFKVDFKMLPKEDLLNIFLKIVPQDSSYINSIVEYAEGSVKNGMKRYNMILKNNMTFTDKTTFIDFASLIMKINDSEELIYVIQDLLYYSLKMYKIDFNNKFIYFSDNLLDILKRLEYNINLRIAKTYVLTKLYGVLSEKD